MAPDDSPSRKLYREILDSIDLFQEQPLPLSVQIREVTFEFNIDPRLGPGWREKIAVLLRAAIAARAPEG